MPTRWPRLLASVAVLCGTSIASPAQTTPGPEWAEYFPGFAACALIQTRDRYDEKRLEYRPTQCARPLSPCSTFKIPHALIGLQAGVVSGPDALKEWDGQKHSRPALNRDHDLASAVRHSVVWYFQEMARDIGITRMQAWLDRLDYGNRDLSGGLDRFWLGDSLEIDAYGQLALIRALWRGALPFQAEVQRDVRDMLHSETTLPGKLFGKTGTCNGPADRDGHAWFIGWVEWNRRRERNPATTWFVVNIVGPGASGSNAREMAVELLRDQQPK